jgi:phage terminase large subunit
MSDATDFLEPPPPEATPPITIPYTPRRHFRPVHASTKRFMFVVAHRRAGKTVALANQLIRAALTNPRRHPPPRYAYIGPSFDQVKDLVWSYLKHYTASIPGIRYLEGELTVILPSGATIRLYGGGQAYERLRGIYLDGAVLDEFPLLNPKAFTSVVRPALADYRGFAIVSGTSNGDDHFHALMLRAEGDETWDVFDIKLTETAEDALSYAEQKDLTSDMPGDEYAREMLNAFDAPIEGAYYTEAMNALQNQGRVTQVPVNLSQNLVTGWDIGMHDFTCIWVFQLSGKSMNFVDYIEDRGKTADHYIALLDARAKSWGTGYQAHILPHDVEVREWTAGSRRLKLMDMTPVPVLTAPRVHDPDGIAAVRGILGVAYFDAQRCKRGLARLRGYKRNKFGTPVHDDASHGADAMKTVATGLPLVTSLSSRLSLGGRLRRRIRGLV